jgi:transcription antitermination protein NusB
LIVGKRRKARELAIQSLYELEAPGKDPAEVLRDQSDRRGGHSDTLDYAGRIVTWTRDDEKELDAAITLRLRNWKMERLSLLTRIILRAILAEARRAPEVPARVLLDEAVELARKFDSEEAGGFVNGILEGLLKEERPEEFATGEGGGA